MPLSRRADALLAWYDANHRDLPWRRTRDPYRILVSEIMLQQTQADRVVPRFERFLDRFPAVDALADATLREVLDEWSGLGYNSRAKRLHEAARIITRDGWPTTAAGLRELPGVGPYTSAAVASFAFGETIAVVDTNVRRVLGRWVGRPLATAEAARVASEVLARDAATWNQAVMELGAVVCRPRNPRCPVCPVATWCEDPTVYTPPPRQSPFDGSRRQVRGAVIRALRDGPMTTDQIVAIAGQRSDLSSILEDLAVEGLIAGGSGTWMLPD